MLPRYLASVVYPKIAQTQRDSDVKRLLMIYRSILITFSLSLFVGMVEVLTGFTSVQLPNLLFLLCYLTSLILCRQKKYLAARNLFILALNSDLFISNHLLGKDAGLYLFMFPVVAGTFFLFDKKEWKQLLFYAFIPVVLMTASIITEWNLPHLAENPPSKFEFHYILSLILSISTTLYLTKYYTDRYQESKEISRKKTAQLQTLVENISHEIWMIDRNYQLVEFNTAFEQTLFKQFNIAIHKGDDIRSILEKISNNSTYQPSIEPYERALRGETTDIAEAIAYGGEISYKEIRFKPFFLNERIEGIVITSNDVTEKTRQEQTLRQNLEEKNALAVVAKSIQHGIVITDAGMNIEWCNPYFESQTGYQLEKIREQDASGLLNGSLTHTPAIQHFNYETLQGKSANTEIILYKKNGDPFWTQINSSPVYNEQQEHVKNILIYIDISARKQSEEQQQLLLSHAQSLNKQLASRDLELQRNIRLLNKQSWDLQVSQQALEKNQTTLQSTNSALTRKAQQLEQSNSLLTVKMRELEDARMSLQNKAAQLEQASKYKSEFLANMSHELRTPLNSIIILSRLLSENKEANLSRKQLEFASVVHKSGTDLLNLINDILDLSKIEAGRIEIEKSDVHSAAICEEVITTIQQQAHEKKIIFNYQADTEEHCMINTDQFRLSQILKNLLSNAIKFTPEGGAVTLSVSRTGDHRLAFSVIDTGIGIPAAKQRLIFESFRQVDGSISRRYGGTGLGLSISKELTHLLGGEITVSSQEGHGSTFTVTFPVAVQPSAYPSEPGKTLLIVEDDEIFADILERKAMEEGFKTEICYRGDTAYMRICQIQPAAILLDMNIPGIDGWSLLKKISQNPEISQIPVHVVSSSKTMKGVDPNSIVSWIEKPVSKEQLTSIFTALKINLRQEKKVLLIEDSPEQGLLVRQILQRQGIECDLAETGTDGSRKLKSENYDCIILDLNLPDSDGMNLLKVFKEEPSYSPIPVIVYSSRELNSAEKNFLKDYASAYINKSTQAVEALMEETTLFLQSINEQKNRRAIFSNLPKAEGLIGKKILVVDDDHRNRYALSSMLEIYGLEIETAESGEKAIDYLSHHPETDMILMDVMMPGMDGYQATREIRKTEQLKNIPIIAVTAKAMKGDREICLSSGMNEHITKPVDGPSLIRLLNNFFQ